jgi:uncharacterized protein YjbI with pentapeptide repeats
MPQTVLSKSDLIAMLREGRIRKWNEYRTANPAPVDLSYADLTRAYLNRANLFDSDLSEANLVGANLSGANLRGANLVEANLRGANYTYATMSRAQYALFEQAQRNTIIFLD